MGDPPPPIGFFRMLLNRLLRVVGTKRIESEEKVRESGKNVRRKWRESKEKVRESGKNVRRKWKKEERK
jgi:hypothetical protein